MANRKLRIAVIGLGKMGLLHTSILHVIPYVEVVALVDKSTVMTKLCKKLFSPKGIIVLNDFENLTGMDLDAVYVTTPISSHSFIIENLFKRGIAHNIFVEKTLTSNYEQSKELRDHAEKLGGVTMVGYMKRFSVVFGKAKELLDHNTVGEPYSFRAYAYSSDFRGLTNDSTSSAPRGGALRDIGCHVIDLALWLLGDLHVCSVSNSANAKTLSDTSVSFSVQSSTGLKGHFDISQRMLNYRMPEFGLSIQCSKGRVEVNDDRLILTLEDGGQRKWYRPDLNDNVSFFLGETEYTRENQSFTNSILNRSLCVPDFDTGSKVDRLIDQVRKELSNVED